MATGQTILSLASIVLLAIVTMSIRQMYVQSVHNTVDTQETADALNFGRDIAEDLHSYAFMFDQIDNSVYAGMAANLNDLTEEEFTEGENSKYLKFESQIDGILYATVELFGVEELIHGQMGRRAVIRIYKEERNNDNRMVAEYVTAISDLTPNE
jgi:hypothetical protein